MVVDRAKEHDEQRHSFEVNGEVRLKKRLTEPTLLEMSGNATIRSYQGPSRRIAGDKQISQHLSSLTTLATLLVRTIVRNNCQLGIVFTCKETATA